MPLAHKSLQGKLLLDGGKLQGSFFHRSVVLICHHDNDGAFGLVLNRTSEKKVGEALVANLPETVRGQELFLGGPVQPGSLSFLHSQPGLLEPNVMAELNVGHSLEMLMDLSDAPAPAQKLKLFAGYSGWSGGQLEEEMARESWLVHPASLELVFTPEPARLWNAILRQKGPLSRLLADAPDDLSWN